MGRRYVTEPPAPTCFDNIHPLIGDYDASSIAIPHKSLTVILQVQVFANNKYIMLGGSLVTGIAGPHVADGRQGVVLQLGGWAWG
jgi:hypothetical protein